MNDVWKPGIDREETEWLLEMGKEVEGSSHFMLLINLLLSS